MGPTHPPARTPPMSPTVDHGPIYEFVLSRCGAAPRSAPPWDFVAPPADAPGPVADPGRALAPPRAAAPPAAGTGARPTLALVGWSVAAVHGAAPPALAHTVARLDAARRHLGVGLAGVGAWVPTPAELDALRFRLSLRDRDAVRELL